MKKYQLALFDIDGTIADTSEGVINCVKYTEYKMNLPPLDADTYKKFIGPPNREAYGRYYGLTESRLSRAVGFHKAYALDKGIFEAKLYPGIRSILDCLKRGEVLMAAATLKQQEAAEKMLRYLGIDEYFIVVSGDRGESVDKRGLICRCLMETGVCEKDAVLIGDSRYDQAGAAESGIDFIGVTYGFGFRREDDLKSLPYIMAAQDTEEIHRLFEEEKKL